MTAGRSLLDPHHEVLDDGVAFEGRNAQGRMRLRWSGPASSPGRVAGCPVGEDLLSSIEAGDRAVIGAPHGRFDDRGHGFLAYLADPVVEEGLTRRCSTVDMVAGLVRSVLPPPRLSACGDRVPSGTRDAPSD